MGRLRPRCRAGQRLWRRHRRGNDRDWRQRRHGRGDERRGDERRGDERRRGERGAASGGATSGGAPGSGGTSPDCYVALHLEDCCSEPVVADGLVGSNDPCLVPYTAWGPTAAQLEQCPAAEACMAVNCINPPPRSRVTTRGADGVCTWVEECADTGDCTVAVDHHRCCPSRGLSPGARGEPIPASRPSGSPAPRVARTAAWWTAPAVSSSCRSLRASPSESATWRSAPDTEGLGWVAPGSGGFTGCGHRLGRRARAGRSGSGRGLERHGVEVCAAHGALNRARIGRAPVVGRRGGHVLDGAVNPGGAAGGRAARVALRGALEVALVGAPIEGAPRGRAAARGVAVVVAARAGLPDGCAGGVAGVGAEVVGAAAPAVSQAATLPSWSRQLPVQASVQPPSHRLVPGASQRSEQE